MNLRELKLNENESKGNCVIYVMSRDQRVRDNHALLIAQANAAELNIPLVVVFNLLPKTGVRSKEHFEFMVAGLKEVEKSLDELGIDFVLTFGDPAVELVKIAEELNAAKVIFDFNPLNGVRANQKEIAKQLKGAASVVDAHNIIPLWVLSDKEEFAAHTIRSKVHRNLREWLVEFEDLKPQSKRLEAATKPEWSKVDKFIAGVERCGINISFEPGEKAARQALDDFIKDRLPNYARDRNVPTLEGQSDLSPYLHFGMISAQRVALEVAKAMDGQPLLFDKGKLASYEGEHTLDDSANAFLEELIVRKELADNYCFYNQNYYKLEGAKSWAIESLQAHEGDDREYIYSREEWEKAQTHDKAWNAAQIQLRRTGKIHGYMRMYWAKKILEWTENPQTAIEYAIYLNDKYSIDGGDPNGYVGIMWSIAGVHDRPWFEREVFGKIRFMNEGGLKRRFDVEEYAKQWS